MRERHVAWRHAPVDQSVERVRMAGDGGLGLLRGLLVHRDVVVDAFVVVVYRHRQGALCHVLTLKGVRFVETLETYMSYHHMLQCYTRSFSYSANNRS